MEIYYREVEQVRMEDKKKSAVILGKIEINKFKFSFGYPNVLETKIH